jgi:hypothetical protein
MAEYKHYPGFSFDDLVIDQAKNRHQWRVFTKSEETAAAANAPDPGRTA